jgi:hypothetical protein
MTYDSNTTLLTSADVRVFRSRNCSSFAALLTGFLFLPNSLRLPPSPASLQLPIARSRGFRPLQVLPGSPTTDEALHRHFACAYRFAYADGQSATPPVLLRSRAVLPYRAVRKHLGAAGE